MPAEIWFQEKSSTGTVHYCQVICTGKIERIVKAFKWSSLNISNRKYCCIEKWWPWCTAMYRYFPCLWPWHCQRPKSEFVPIRLTPPSVYVPTAMHLPHIYIYVPTADLCPMYLYWSQFPNMYLHLLLTSSYAPTADLSLCTCICTYSLPVYMYLLVTPACVLYM